MKKLRKSLYVILSIVTVVVMLASILSVFRNTPSNYLKMLDFPRIQFFLACLILIPLFAWTTKRWLWYDYSLVIGLIGGLIIHGTYLINYTGLVANQVPQASSKYAPNDQISLLLANVKMKNRTAEPLLTLISEKRPDFLVLMEVDAWWVDQLNEIVEAYPYKKELPNQVAYGMALYSKYPLENLKVNRLNNEKVPSFESTIRLANGRSMVLHTLHPVPPKDFKKLPDNRGENEVALLKAGEFVEESNLPNVLVGDLNDVVWGYTDILTGTDNLLFDVRVGRGFYNSFDAHTWWMRWPIDHIFVTKEFTLQRLEKLPKIGSDHYPMYVELVLEEG